MNRPKTTSMLLASKWVTHLTNEPAWDEMREVVASEPERAWSLIQALVGFAPDYDVLATIAAGPVEDLLYRHGELFITAIAEAAKTNARWRVCLSAVHSNFPPELSRIVEGETADIRDLPIDGSVTASGEDLALILGWLHHSDTAWASEFLTEMTDNDAGAAWDALRVLAVFAEEDRRIEASVFDDAFKPFIRRHFEAYREELLDLAQKNTAFRRWALDRKRPPFDDTDTWATFVADLA